MALSVGWDADVEGPPLCVELINIKSSVKIKIPTPLNILNFTKKFNMEDLYSNICCFIFINHVTFCRRGEKSSSKLKLIKIYLRSSVWQERLSSPAIHSIESTIPQNLDFSELVKTFAVANAEKSTFIETFCKYLFSHTCAFYIQNTINFYR